MSASFDDIHEAACGIDKNSSRKDDNKFYYFEIDPRQRQLRYAVTRHDWRINRNIGEQRFFNHSPVIRQCVAGDGWICRVNVCRYTRVNETLLVSKRNKMILIILLHIMNLNCSCCCRMAAGEIVVDVVGIRRYCLMHFTTCQRLSFLSFALWLINKI